MPVDLRTLRQGNAGERRDQVRSLMDGLRENGHAVIANHGLALDRAGQARASFEALFAERSIEDLAASSKDEARGVYLRFVDGLRLVRYVMGRERPPSPKSGEESTLPPNAWPPGFDPDPLRAFFHDLGRVADELCRVLDGEIPRFSALVANGDHLLEGFSAEQSAEPDAEVALESLFSIVVPSIGSTAGVQTDDYWEAVAATPRELVVLTGSLLPLTAARANFRPLPLHPVRLPPFDGPWLGAQFHVRPHPSQLDSLRP